MLTWPAVRTELLSSKGSASICHLWNILKRKSEAKFVSSVIRVGSLCMEEMPTKSKPANAKRQDFAWFVRSPMAASRNGYNVHQKVS